MADLCQLCKQPIATAVTGRQPYGDGFACDDCYFDAMSDLLESAPIGNPRRGRGQSD